MTMHSTSTRNCMTHKCMTFPLLETTEVLSLSLRTVLHHSELLRKKGGMKRLLLYRRALPTLSQHPDSMKNLGVGCWQDLNVSLWSHLAIWPAGQGVLVMPSPPSALSPLPVILCASSSAVDRALQLPGVWEDVLMLDDDGFDQLIHVGLAGHLVVALRH